MVFNIFELLSDGGWEKYIKDEELKKVPYSKDEPTPEYKKYGKCHSTCFFIIEQKNITFSGTVKM